jgi:predicted nucleotide-binding protein (sugar kinase/HSP70/actin superfamily)
MTILILPFGCAPNLIVHLCVSMKSEIKEIHPEFDVKYPFTDLGKMLNDMVLIQ